MSLAQLVQTMDYEALGLSEDEMRAYRRWYTDLLLRKGNQAVRIEDTLKFLSNFMIEQQKITLMDALDNQIKTLDPVQFYAFIRLAGHVLSGEELRPECLFMAAQVPLPRSILSGKKKENTESSKGGGLLANPFRKKEKLDLDSFTKFIMTGNRPGGDRKKSKKVTFNEEPEVAEAAARSMEELMRQRGLMAPPVMYEQPEYNNIPAVTVTEDEPEEDVEIDSNFQNVNIDSVLHNGVSNVADMSDYQAPSFSPSPSPSPQPGYPYQQQQQQQSQPQPQAIQSHPQLNLPSSTEQREQLSRFVPLQPTPTGSQNSSNSSLNHHLQPLTPQQQFLQTMSPHRGPSPNPPPNNSAPAFQPSSLSYETPSVPSPPKHLSPNPSSTNLLQASTPNLQVPSTHFASPQPQNSPPVALSQFQSQMQHMKPPPPPPPPPPPSRLRALTTSSLPSIPPPPPQPRRNISGGGSYARPTPQQSSPQLPLPSPQSFSSQLQQTPSPQFQEPQPQYAPQVQQFQNTMLPPPPPPPRSRATSSPGVYSPQLQQFQQPFPQQFTGGSPMPNGGGQYANGQLNQYSNGQYQANGQYPQQTQYNAPYHTSSAPDLLADLKALQDEVDRLRR